MSLSIFDFGNWQQNTTYNLYDIYRYNNMYYYAIIKHNSGNIFNSDYSNGTILYNGVTMPYFFFIPSYNSELSIKPNVKITQFGNGYRQVSPDGINNVLLPFTLTFDKRTDVESRAILHFLNEKQGYKSFIFTPPPPFNKNKIFKCEEWNYIKVFSNNNTITCKFYESPV